MRALVLLVLPLLSACVEAASAQPRPDAGRRFLVRPPSQPLPRASEARRTLLQNRSVLRLLGASSDGGVALRGLLGTVPDDGFGGLGGLGGGTWGPTLGRPSSRPPGAGLGLRGVMPDGGIPLGTVGGGGLGSRGSQPGSGTGAGYGRWNVGPRRDVRFDEVSVQGDLPRWAVVSELSHAAARTHNCLIAFGPHGAIDAPVRLVVRPPTTLDGITVEGASENVTRCAREALQRMILGPVTAPVEVGAWLRAAAVTP
ncbi:MAG: hypothetical protein U0325_18835 [Polyangiales bacterium]